MGEGEETPKWTADVPEPEASVVSEDGRYRAELTNYVQKGGRVKDIRIRGPARSTRKEARKDCAELRKAALKSGGTDPALFHARARRKELESVKWKEKDLVDVDREEEDEDRRQRKEDEEKKKEAERRRQQEPEMSHSEVLARIVAQAPEPAGDDAAVLQALEFLKKKEKQQSNRFKPVGPNWRRPGTLVHLPDIEGASWMIHEKQDSTGKYRAWLFFNAGTGKYYRQKDSGKGYIQTGVPHDPREFPMTVRLGSANLVSSTGKKLIMSVLLPELHKTGFLLKQSLEFLDKPASLFVLCEGLRNVASGAEFCARKLHTILLPKLSARATEWEDFELVDVLRDTAEALDGLLLESPACLAGCSLAVGVLAGTRLVLGVLGGVRCTVCQPGPAAPQRGAAAAPAPWRARLLLGGPSLHSGASEDERLRIESAGNRILMANGTGSGSGKNDIELTAGSASAACLASIEDERERILVQVSRAANPFATLGVAPADLGEGPAAIRKVFRKRSLLVHPDKVDEAKKPRAVAVFAKLEAAATAVEAMMKCDAAATVLLAEVDLAHDTAQLLANPAAAAQLLGVPEGSEAEAARQASKRKFHGPLSRLQGICRSDVDRALKILEIAEESVARGTTLWSPPQKDEALHLTRALGCKDLKVPVPLLASGLVVECVELQPGTTAGVALLTGSMQSVSDAEVARQLARHCPSRPRAAALQLALQGAKGENSTGVGAICAYFKFDAMSGGDAVASAPPAAKRAKTAKPDRVRISHILLRWAGLSGDDEFARPGMEPPQRTQADAERELLEMLEGLMSGDPKTLGTRFKAQVLKCSECASALNVPYADLGWIEQGGAEPAVEIAAFDAPVGGLSDVVVSQRGAHLMYRLA